MLSPITQKPMKPVFQKTILQKYNVTYFQCEESGFLTTESPYWLNEAYQSAIACTDTGLVQRNLSNSRWLSVAIKLLLSPKGKYLDIAGGYGLLARLMRDEGFDFYTIDKYCTNIFAPLFEPDKTFSANALCAFEVLEHIENPVSFISENFSHYNCETLFFSTLTFPNGTLPPEDWWYFSCDTGQHISFYQKKTLQMIADSLSLNYYCFSTGLHLITNKQINVFKKNILSQKKLTTLLYFLFFLFYSPESKIWKDHLLLKKMREKHENIL